VSLAFRVGRDLVDRELTASFIMPARDVEAFIAESIDSALAQTEPDLEVIVVDDGSTDRTARIASEKGRADPRVRVVSQRPSGVSAARDAALRLARGRYVCFLDADDLAPPDKLRVQAGILDGRPEIDVVYSDCFRLVPGPAGDWIAGPRMESEADARSAILEARAPFQFHCALLRRCAVERVGGFGAGPVRVEDTYLYARLLLAGARFLHVPEPCGFYRIRPGSLSKDDLGMTHGRRFVATWLLEHLGRECRKERKYLRLRARYLTILEGAILAGRGRTFAARRTFLLSLWQAWRPGQAWESFRYFISPGRAMAGFSAERAGSG
jgi:glycosyltransferase involved in cell wall biosynthesis